MNMKKWKRRTIALLLALLVSVTGLKQAAYAEESTPTTYTVTDYSSFKNAVKVAKDGDIITIWNVVTVADTLTVGSDDIHLTIKKGDENSYLNFISGETVFTNVTFDGGGIISKYSFMKIDAENMSFTDCVFQNCGNPTYQGGTGSIGGAVRVDRGIITFSDCYFAKNSGIAGGHIAICNDSVVNVIGCTLMQGIAGHGGAIEVANSSGTCNIKSSIITENKAGDFGGGIGNWGKVTVEQTKLYNNTATNGGADIGNTTTGTIELKDTIEQLAELFELDRILPVAWVCDYDFEENIYIPDVDPNQKNALLKLQYEIIPDDSEDETESTEPGTEEGTESTDPSEPSTEQPTTPPDEDETTDPTDEPTEAPTDPSEPEETDPDDTEDTKEPTTPTEPGTDAPDDSEQDTTPDDTDPSEPSQPVGDTNTDNSTQTDNSNNSVNTDNSDNSTHTDNSDNSSVDNSSVDNSVTNNDSSSSSTTSNNTVDNSSVDNSKVDNSNVSNNSDSSTTTTNTTTTTNNYYTTESNQSPGQTAAQPIVIQVQNDSAAPDVYDEKVSDSGSSSPNIRIDAQGVDCVFEYVDGVYNISITAQKEADESDAVVPAVASVQAVEDSGGQEVEWLEVIQIVLLVAIFICLIWQPKRTGNRNIQGQE